MQLIFVPESQNAANQLELRKWSLKIYMILQINGFALTIT